MLVYSNPRDYKTLSRYSIYKQIIDTTNNNTYLESPNKFNISDTDTMYHVVSNTEENRLDIISSIYYNTPTLYWAIAEANNIIDPSVVVKGTILKIPSYESLYTTGGPLIRRG